MFGFSIKLSLKKAAVFATLIVALAAVVMFLGGNRKIGIMAQTEQDRIDYICSLGYSPSAVSAEAEQVTIPQNFSKVYENYNLIQIQAGFDLKQYKGCEVMRYSYSLNDYPAEEYVVANLLVFDGEIIGGDISSRRLDGFMLPLKAKENGQN